MKYFIGTLIFTLIGLGLYLDWKVALTIILAAFLHNFYKGL